MMIQRTLDGIDFIFYTDEEGMKAERVQDRFTPLDGWELIMRPSQTIRGEEEPDALWTAFEAADHFEACELVGQIGEIADVYCVRPQIDVRGHVVFLTAKTPKFGIAERDFDFAEAIDCELGRGLKAKGLLARAC